MGVLRSLVEGGSAGSCTSWPPGMCTSSLFIYSVPKLPPPNIIPPSHIMLQTHPPSQREIAIGHVSCSLSGLVTGPLFSSLAALGNVLVSGSGVSRSRGGLSSITLLANLILTTPEQLVYITSGFLARAGTTIEASVFLANEV